MVGFTSVSPGKPLPKIREETLPDYLFERASYFTQLGRTVFLVRKYKKSRSVRIPYYFSCRVGGRADRGAEDVQGL